MTEIAERIIVKAKEILQNGIHELEKLQSSLKEASPEAVAGLTDDGLEKLSWKLYPNGKGAWIFSNLEQPAAKELKAFLDRAGGKLDLHGYQYRLSGDRKQFIARFKASSSVLE